MYDINSATKLNWDISLFNVYFNKSNETKVANYGLNMKAMN